MYAQLGDFQNWQDATTYACSLRRLLRDLARTPAGAGGATAH
jgi:hypothetical protein